MKKRFALIIAFVMLLALTTACNNSKQCQHVDADDNKLCDLCNEAYDDGPNGPQEYEFLTPVTDRVKLEEDYQGKDFVKDGIGVATVVAYTDGDTAIFRTSGGSKITVRFLGIDTPESTYKVDPWGFAASSHTKNALKNANEIVLQAESSDPNLRLDSTGKRYLAWVWVDGRLLNLEIAEVGLGTADASDTRYASEFIEAINAVRQAKERIYGTRNDPNFDYDSPREELSIKELRARYATPEAISSSLDAGKRVTVTGTVTKRFGSGCCYIQQADEDGNYYGIYLYGGYNQIKAFDVGTTITVKGTVGYYFGQLQLSSITSGSIKVWSYTNKDAVTTIDTRLDEISIYNSVLNGNLVEIQEELVITGYYNSEENNAFTLKTNYKCSDGNYLDIRVDQNINLVDENGNRITSGEQFVGKTITSIIAIASYYDPNFGSQSPEQYDGHIQLMWANYSDVTFK